MYMEYLKASVSMILSVVAYGNRQFFVVDQFIAFMELHQSI